MPTNSDGERPAIEAFFSGVSLIAQKSRVYAGHMERLAEDLATPERLSADSIADIQSSGPAATQAIAELEAAFTEVTTQARRVAEMLSPYIPRRDS